MTKVPCKFCGEELNVGDYKKSIVVLCIPDLKAKPIRQCETKLWGSAKTRFEVGSVDNVIRHVVQTEPGDDAPRVLRRAS